MAEAPFDTRSLDDRLNAPAASAGMDHGEVRDLEAPIAHAIAIVLRESPGERAIDRLAEILRSEAQGLPCPQPPPLQQPQQSDPSLPHVLEAALREALEQILIDQPSEPLLTLPELLEKNVHELRVQERILTGLAKLLNEQSGQITRLLSQWDADGNGAISRSEWHTHVMSAIGLNSDDPEMTTLKACNLMFDTFDINASGQLEFAELKSLLGRIMEHGIRAVRATDVNQRGHEYVEIGRAHV